MKRSFSLINSDTIRKHQANNSSSKNAYAFSKTSRFPEPNPECKVPYYRANDSQLSNRKASFGYGTKADFTKTLSPSPSPDNYNIKSCFELSKERGLSFGTARDRLPDQAYTIPQLRHVPGPGAYEHNKKTISPMKYTMRPKPKDFIEEKLTYKNNPGPGAYEAVDMDPKTGRYSISKFCDCKLAKIEPNRSRFDRTNSNQTPSSFHYQEKDGIHKSAKYILSKNKGSGIRAFTSSKRLTFMDEREREGKKLPGPGNYDPPSDFGVYGLNGDNLVATSRK